MAAVASVRSLCSCGPMVAIVGARLSKSVLYSSLKVCVKLLYNWNSGQRAKRKTNTHATTLSCSTLKMSLGIEYIDSQAFGLIFFLTKLTSLLVLIATKIVDLAVCTNICLFDLILVGSGRQLLDFQNLALVDQSPNEMKIFMPEVLHILNNQEVVISFLDIPNYIFFIFEI